MGDPKQTVRLLVIEDSLPYLYLIQKAFQDRQREIRWELTVAKDREQALQLLFDEENKSILLPQLILLDWNLPKVSGNRVLQRLKNDPKLCRIPVLVFSSSDAPDDIYAAYDNHANGYVTKPQSIALLAAIVEAIEQFWIAVATLPITTR